MRPSSTSPQLKLLKKNAPPRPANRKALLDDDEVEELEDEASETLQASQAVVEAPPSDPRDLIGWSAVALHDEATGKRSYEVSMPDSFGGRTTHELSMALSRAQMVRELRAYGNLPVGQHTAVNAINSLLQNATMFVRCTKPGWKPDADSSGSPPSFVLPGAIIPAQATFRWASTSRGRLGASKGEHSAWIADVGSYAKHSNYIAFGILTALASPLVRFAGLSESAIFNLYGPSSVGKTTVARVAMSTVGSADDIQNWDLKPRALEEIAAQHNDCPLILNGAERLTPTEQKQLVSRIVHMLPDGGGTGRSLAVRDNLPNVTWRNIVLSTSNPPGREMAGRWDEQDSVRFIDIPVPPVHEGGIFDRGGTNAVVRAKAANGYLKRIEDGIAANYGVLWPRYIEHLMTSDISSLVRAHVQRYLTLTAPTPGIEERIAKKFAILFAAGEIAQSAGLLGWHSQRVKNAVRLIHQRSITSRHLPSDRLRSALEEIATARSPLIRDLSKEKALRISVVGDWIGVRTMHRGVEVLGFRREDVQARYSPATSNAIFAWLETNGLIVGDRLGTQLHVDLTIGSAGVMKKPRFVLTDAAKLKSTISKS
jgi:hypothetical protein